MREQAKGGITADTNPEKLDMGSKSNRIHRRPSSKTRSNTHLKKQTKTHKLDTETKEKQTWRHDRGD